MASSFIHRQTATPQQPVLEEVGWVLPLTLPPALCPSPAPCPLPLPPAQATLHQSLGQAWDTRGCLGSTQQGSRRNGLTPDPHPRTCRPSSPGTMTFSS